MRTRAAAAVGGFLYVLVHGLLVGAATQTSGTVRAVGSLLALGLLAEVVRRLPVAALVLVLLGVTFMIAGDPSAAGARSSVAYQGQFLAYLAADFVLARIVATRPRRTAIAAATVTGAVPLLMTGAFSRGNSMTVNVLITLLALLASCATGLLARERREHAVALREQEVTEAVTAERLRIARELHDMVAHSIGIIAIQAGAGNRVIHTQPAKAQQALQAIEDTSREALSGLRRTLVSLRRADPGTAAPPASPLPPAPGLADVERLAAGTAAAGVRVEVHRTGDARPLPPDIDLSAYRIVQEALTNVVRHAGTGHCHVTIGHEDGELSVEVVDDGRGPGDEPGSRPGGPRPGHGFGLVGMRERVALLNGRFSAGPGHHGGFRVSARLPLPETTSVVLESR
ncbi:sensor histidine kinase [Streptomyces sp. NBC_00237]|uniref:sensor histidine kinase n=1 Tax=Streptomyces sp. NBC_00237 TaxID=2975687 RepID=UPI00224D57C1|nr:sensor histidine kinase [Streptomyces sp. NBC_00237]MCX5206169.1 sensor histidine kinase [Streptomyces sp. NBC_00237]